MAKPDIWMPLFIGDYLADTSRLTTEQHGAYLLLIMDYWRNGSPPDDDQVLANITKMQSKEWKRVKSVIMKFFKLEGDIYRHSRIDSELLKATQNAEKFAERAKNAANKRWKKDASSNASSIIQASLEECPSPSPLSKTNDVTHSIEAPTIIEPSLAASVCMAIKELGFTGTNPTNPKLLALLAAGATKEEFINAANQAKVKTLAYVIGTVTGMREQAASDVLVKGKTLSRKQKSTIGTLEGNDYTLGVPEETKGRHQNWRMNDALIVEKAHKLKISTPGKNRFELLALIDTAVHEQGKQVATA